MSQSSSTPRRHRVPPGPLPLIMCPNCGVVRVRCWVSNTEANPGLRFYRCPNQRSGGDPCDAWWWEDEYASFITGTGLNLLFAAAGGNFMLRHHGGIRELMSTSSSTWAICLVLLLAQVMRMVQERF